MDHRRSMSIISGCPAGPQTHSINVRVKADTGDDSHSTQPSSADLRPLSVSVSVNAAQRPAAETVHADGWWNYIVPVLKRYYRFLVTFCQKRDWSQTIFFFACSFLCFSTEELKITTDVRSSAAPPADRELHNIVLLNLAAEMHHWTQGFYTDIKHKTWYRVQKDFFLGPLTLTKMLPLCLKWACLIQFYCFLATRLLLFMSMWCSTTIWNSSLRLLKENVILNKLISSSISPNKPWEFIRGNFRGQIAKKVFVFYSLVSICVQSNLLCQFQLLLSTVQR